LTKGQQGTFGGSVEMMLATTLVVSHLDSEFHIHFERIKVTVPEIVIDVEVCVGGGG
jgi:hypothetical protein